ncbi:unnamed protein product [Paramecium sonneborni]|uniref:Uncharacterized protein n=1 Tax=Paramecium sonneborni TaxID=65129 RepID=A0A8S1QYR5_9CILI|nr:unnamed protein product [Paramecium sonneborni]
MQTVEVQFAQLEHIQICVCEDRTYSNSLIGISHYYNEANSCKWYSYCKFNDSLTVFINIRTWINYDSNVIAFNTSNLLYGYQIVLTQYLGSHVEQFQLLNYNYNT